MEKRKTIVIHQENVSPIFLEDEDDRSLEDYSQALSSFMTLTNISILHTSTASIITRPSKICSITIHEESIYKDLPEPVTSDLEEPVEKQVVKEEVDIITDVDT